MSMPYEIWIVLLTLAVVCTGYLFFVHDKNNYTEAIAGVVAIIFWIASGLCFVVGLSAEGDVYTSTGLMWVFIAIGIITGLITFVKILDIVTTRKKEKDNHVNMSPIRL